MAQERKHLDATAFAWMLGLTMLWGVHQVVVKLTAPDVSLVMQAGIRSIVAATLVLVWARLRGVALFGRDGTLAAGVVAGVLFAVEFIFIFGGLGLTGASRMAVFIYLAPALTALGLHLFVPGERLRGAQWAGVALAFGGIVVAFSDGFLSQKQGLQVDLRGDLCGLLGALFWAATTVLIRASRLSQAPPAKTLFYQLGVSALILPVASLALGEPGVVALTPLALSSLAFQALIIAFASYLAWFWLLSRYLGTQLSVLSFMTPLFGVASGVLFLGEPLTLRFLVAALLVGAGIVLVNLRR
jgi:drug/metabolite transporter (DMT)-like permease